MKLQFLPEAKSELIETVEYYENLEVGLGIRFKEEVLNVLEWIRENSDKPRLRKNEYRRVNLKVFPYHVIYVIRGQALFVVAIPHSRRKPEFWKIRKTS